MFSLPKILIRIKRENAWLKAYMELGRPDAVISDNRYGLHHKGIFSVFITHQLMIKTPFGKWADKWLQRLNYRAIGRFSACWVPDWETGSAVEPIPLAGELSHPRKLPAVPLRYIGPLSRFSRADGQEAEECDLLVLVSGPEPQRSLFEELMRKQLMQFTGRSILVRGLPALAKAGPPAQVASQVAANASREYDHLPAAQLNKLIDGAALVLSRPGYSSVMDLFRLGKKCIFIPTPGQTEQEYLGAYLSGKQLALSVSQRDFHLLDALRQAAAFPFRNLPFDAAGRTGEATGNGPLRAALADLVEKLSTLPES
ncbi:MAG: glycosyltransferase [Bacteroidota bacterium]|nr:glycosyltransferase [Bacteroidota bacterium]